MGNRQSGAQNHDVPGLVDAMLSLGLAVQATDVHFEPGDKGLLVRVRIDGQLVDLELLPTSLTENVVSRLKVLASLLTYRVDIPQEGSFLWERGSAGASDDPVDLRVATFPTIRGERAVVRVFRGTSELRSLDTLGLHPEQVSLIRSALAQPAGFIVASGPAGSGKTTTLYAMIREVRDQSAGRSVITLEDPVEQRIDLITQIQINPHGELGYERCMRSLLRQDPQVMLLGEVRDRQTAAVAVEAALTGHLVLTTVHSGDPADTIVRFLEMGIPAYQLTSVLTLVCSQRLLRKTCLECSGASSRGCEACLGTGYAGRSAVAQLTQIDEQARTLILRCATASELRRELKRQGPDMIDRAIALVTSGTTDECEVGRVLGRRPSA